MNCNYTNDLGLESALSDRLFRGNDKSVSRQITLRLKPVGNAIISDEYVKLGSKCWVFQSELFFYLGFVLSCRGFCLSSVLSLSDLACALIFPAALLTCEGVFGSCSGIFLSVLEWDA